jgi:hypothetical protein
MPFNKKSPLSQIKSSIPSIDGQIIFQVRKGRPDFLVVASSDTEERRLLLAFRDAIIVGDLWALIEE